MKIELYNEDCKETMKRIPDGSIDLMLTDIPYGTTACEWDVLPNLAEMWFEWERILKPNGAWIFTAAQPATSSIVMSRLGFFKYDLIWNKKRPTGHLNKDIMPMRQHEEILIFGRGRICYNPQFHQDKLNRDFRGLNKKPHTDNYGTQKNYISQLDPSKSYPRSLINCTAVIGNSRQKMNHPTQKPVDLFRYLIKTYSNEGETVYDGYSGSGTTAIACIMENRNFIGAELNKEYYDAAKKRIDAKLSQPALF